MRKKYVGAGFTSALLALCLLAIFTVIITACSTNSSNGPNTVHMNDNFDQSSITIKKGESITLVNDKAVFHEIKNGIWDSSGTARNYIEPGAPTVDAQFQGGDSKTFGPFTTAGTFHLYCTVHSDMNLTIIVK